MALQMYVGDFECYRAYTDAGIYHEDGQGKMRTAFLGSYAGVARIDGSIFDARKIFRCVDTESVKGLPFRPSAAYA